MYFINDSLRLLANNTYTDISIFVIKDLSMLLAIISILNFKLIKKLISLLKNNKILTIILILYLIINFSIIDNKILYFAGFYDLFFLFLISFYLSETKKIEIQDINSIFIFLFSIFALLFIIQIIDLKFYKFFFFNNSNSALLNSLFEMKSYNPQINDITGVFIQQNTSVFNNAGRLNHFMVPFFGILLFLYLNTKNKYLLIFLSLTYIFVIINSSRSTLILISLPVIFLLYENYKKIIFSKKFGFMAIFLFFLYALTILFYNNFHYNKFNSKIQSNKSLLIIYHNFYEPILSSFDKKRLKTASSLTGRLKIISNESKEYFIKKNNINISNIIFGNGIGTHSLTTKHLDKNKKYILENSFLIILFEYGIIGFLLIIYLYNNFSEIVLGKIRDDNLLIFSKCILAYPILLLITGYQFYRDFAFQFFFFLLIGLILNHSIMNENHKENYSR